MGSSGMKAAIVFTMELKGAPSGAPFIFERCIRPLTDEIN
jgi:hypothetical protein